jgi:cell wall-associated NlpC family hydrolase
LQTRRASAAFPGSAEGARTLNVEQLIDLIGKPFLDGGRGHDAFDCWGLALEVYRRHGIELPDYRLACLEARPCWLRLERQEPLALVAIRTRGDWINHVGVCLGIDDCFLHTTRGIGAAVARLSNPLYAQRIEGFYRYAPL